MLQDDTDDTVLYEYVVLYTTVVPSSLFPGVRVPRAILEM